VAYAAKETASDPWPDMFRLSPDAASAWIKAHDIEVAIHSFYDDDEWRVVLAAGR
jgi:hypothetical protein